MAPIKSMSGSLDSGPAKEQIEEIMETLELFVGSIDKFIGVFDKNYPGGDFCAGITFGMQGAVMLEKVATTLYETP